MGYLICAKKTLSLPALESVEDEIKALINILDGAKIASTYDEALELAARHHFDGVVLAGHTGEHGFYWGEEIFASDEIARMLSMASSALKWVFINACDSERFVVSIKAVLPHVSIIATRTEVNDEKARRVMRSFLSALVSSSSVDAAVARAKLATPETEYIFYPAESRSVQTTSEELDGETGQRLRELEQRVFGDHRLGIAGIQENLERLDANIQSQKWWSMVNTAATLALILYEVLRNAR